jgi:perosamine synthetase
MRAEPELEPETGCTLSLDLSHNTIRNSIGETIDAGRLKHGSRSQATPFRWPKDPYLSFRTIRWSLTGRGVTVPGAPASHHRCFWGRNGIYHALGFLAISRGDRILVPAYVCSAAIEPILAYGAEVDFYQITRECRPDFEDLVSHVQPRTRGILLVHYFGFPAEIAAFQKISRRYNLVLIEDCAHVLEGNAEEGALGAIGDASVFSWRKFLPLYDGSTLVVNRGRQAYEVSWDSHPTLFGVKVVLNLLDQAARSGRHPVLHWLSKALLNVRSRLLRQIGKGPARRGVLAVDMNTLAFDAHLLNLPMSGLSHWILDHADVAWIKSRRARNYLRLAGALHGTAGIVPLRPNLPQDVCPWVFPLCSVDLPGATGLLRSCGIPVTGWGGVRHPAIPRGKYLDADFLYENLFFLPVHQNLDEDDMARMAQAVREALARAGSHD